MRDEHWPEDLDAMLDEEDIGRMALIGIAIAALCGAMIGLCVGYLVAIWWIGG